MNGHTIFVGEEDLEQMIRSSAMTMPLIYGIGNQFSAGGGSPPGPMLPLGIPPTPTTPLSPSSVFESPFGSNGDINAVFQMMPSTSYPPLHDNSPLSQWFGNQSIFSPPSQPPLTTPAEPTTVNEQQVKQLQQRQQQQQQPDALPIVPFPYSLPDGFEPMALAPDRTDLWTKYAEEKGCYRVDVFSEVYQGVWARFVAPPKTEPSSFKSASGAHDGSFQVGACFEESPFPRIRVTNLTDQQMLVTDASLVKDHSTIVIAHLSDDSSCQIQNVAIGPQAQEFVRVKIPKLPSSTEGSPLGIRLHIRYKLHGNTYNATVTIDNLYSTKCHNEEKNFLSKFNTGRRRTCESMEALLYISESKPGCRRPTTSKMFEEKASLPTSSNILQKLEQIFLHYQNILNLEHAISLRDRLEGKEQQPKQQQQQQQVPKTTEKTKTTKKRQRMQVIPAITQVNPGFGSVLGGDAVTVFLENFGHRPVSEDQINLEFGGVSTLKVLYCSDSAIFCLTPPHDHGFVNVTLSLITAPGSPDSESSSDSASHTQIAQLERGFEYLKSDKEIAERLSKQREDNLRRFIGGGGGGGGNNDNSSNGGSNKHSRGGNGDGGSTTGRGGRGVFEYNFQTRRLTLAPEDAMGRNIVHLAAFYGLSMTVKFLVGFLGFNPDLLDNFGRTPLHMAYYKGDKETVDILLAAGANPDIEDCFGNTPSDMADLTSKATSFNIESSTTTIEVTQPPINAPASNSSDNDNNNNNNNKDSLVGFHDESKRKLPPPRLPSPGPDRATGSSSSSNNNNNKLFFHSVMSKHDDSITAVSTMLRNITLTTALPDAKNAKKAQLMDVIRKRFESDHAQSLADKLEDAKKVLEPKFREFAESVSNPLKCKEYYFDKLGPIRDEFTKLTKEHKDSIEATWRTSTQSIPISLVFFVHYDNDDNDDHPTTSDNTTARSLIRAWNRVGIIFGPYMLDWNESQLIVPKPYAERTTHAHHLLLHHHQGSGSDAALDTTDVIIPLDATTCEKNNNTLVKVCKLITDWNLNWTYSDQQNSYSNNTANSALFVETFMRRMNITPKWQKDGPVDAYFSNLLSNKLVNEKGSLCIWESPQKKIQIRTFEDLKSLHKAKILQEDSNHDGAKRLLPSEYGGASPTLPPPAASINTETTGTAPAAANNEFVPFVRAAEAMFRRYDVMINEPRLAY